MLYVDTDTGFFTDEPPGLLAETHVVDGALISPAFIELQTNGCLGTHFTQFKDPGNYQENLDKVARHLVTQGVGAFYVTLPTVSSEIFQKVCRHSPSFVCAFVPAIRAHNSPPI